MEIGAHIEKETNEGLKLLRTAKADLCKADLPLDCAENEDEDVDARASESAPAPAGHEAEEKKWEILRDELKAAIQKRDAVPQSELGPGKPKKKERKTGIQQNAFPLSCNSRKRLLLKYGAWCTVLAASVVICVVFRPAPLPVFPSPPEPTALSTELRLSDIRVIGNSLHAQVDNWNDLDLNRREAAVSTACRNAATEGFRDIALFDENGELAASCSYTSPEGPADSATIKDPR